MKNFLFLCLFALSIFSTALAEESYSKRFDKHDTNSDGVISLDEFLNHAKQTFEKMDSDSNGVLSKEELKQAKAKKREKKQKRLEENSSDE
jgi:Ca2+-binding EF-hand superfamily protein